MGCGASASHDLSDEERTLQQLEKEKKIQDEAQKRIDQQRQLEADAQRKWPALQFEVLTVVQNLSSQASSLVTQMAEHDKKWFRIQVARHTGHGPIMAFLVRRELESWLHQHQFEFYSVTAEWRYEYWDHGTEYTTVYGTSNDVAYMIRKMF